MHNDAWHKPTRSQMRHDYAHCAYVYPCHRTTALRALTWCAVVFLVSVSVWGVV